MFFLHLPYQQLQGPHCEVSLPSRQFRHPTDLLDGLDDSCKQRFENDDRKFPPGAYQVDRMLWRSDEARLPFSFEKAHIHCIPRCILSAKPREFHETAAQREVIRASQVGNSFHLPSLALILLVLFQAIGRGQAAPTFSYPGAEAYLRSATADTVWQPGVVDSFPGLLSPAAVTAQFSAIFLSEGISLPHLLTPTRCP